MPVDHRWAAISAVLVVALLLVASAAFALVMFRGSVHDAGIYGWGLFVATPCAIGFLAPLIYAIKAPPSYAASFQITGYAMLGVGLVIVAVAWEGLICLAMALPLNLISAAVGTAIAVSCRRRIPKGPGPYLVVIAFPPLVLLGEQAVKPEPPLRHVVSEVTVAAPTPEVWSVLASPIVFGANDGWLFQAGVNHPTAMTLERSGPDPCLRCTLAHGAITATVTRIEDGRLLEFTPDQPAVPMEELTFGDHIHPPHLDGYFRIVQGRFQLLPQADGTTLLRAETSYRYDIWPNAYWSWWTDAILDRMHLGVLAAVKRRAEAMPR